jgi:hypothetical protein
MADIHCFDVAKKFKSTSKVQNKRNSDFSAWRARHFLTEIPFQFKARLLKFNQETASAHALGAKSPNKENGVFFAIHLPTRTFDKPSGEGGRAATCLRPISSFSRSSFSKLPRVSLSKDALSAQMSLHCRVMQHTQKFVLTAPPGMI